jgi:hypothetical protein
MTLQQEIAAYLRELADKVERSSYCAVLASEDKRMYATVNTGEKLIRRIPTGERQVELKLNYIEENDIE